MAKDKSLSKEERKAAKKAAKAATTEPAPTGVTKAKSDKKDKKEKKAKLAEKVETELAKTNGNVDAAGEVVSDEDDADAGPTSSGVKEINGRPVGALVPFANPLADDKVGKKVFKSVKKAAATRTLKRGVKEVVKALRKSPSSNPSSSTAASSLPVGIVVLAADISPMDVISHIPVLCEDHNIPYIYVTSRAELGMASQTKRPTSVVMVARDLVVGKQGKGDKREGGESAEEWSETYKSLSKAVEREGRSVKV